jgi:hypothetical protein
LHTGSLGRPGVGLKNALKDGRFAREDLELRRSVDWLIRASLEVLAHLEEEDSAEP